MCIPVLTSNSTVLISVLMLFLISFLLFNQRSDQTTNLIKTNLYTCIVHRHQKILKHSEKKLHITARLPDFAPKYGNRVLQKLI